VSQRQSHLLVQHRRQGQRLRPQLHAAHTHRIKRLQRMPALHPAATPAAAAHRDLKAAHHRAPYDLFLVLGFVALQLHVPSAARTMLGCGTRKLFIDARGDGAAGASAVGATGFPAWGLGVRFQCSARMRRGLSLARPQRRFQFPTQQLDLLIQALAFLLPLLVLLLQRCDLPLGSVEFLLGLTRRLRAAPYVLVACCGLSSTLR